MSFTDSDLTRLGIQVVRQMVDAKLGPFLRLLTEDDVAKAPELVRTLEVRAVLQSDRALPGAGGFSKPAIDFCRRYRPVGFITPSWVPTSVRGGRVVDPDSGIALRVMSHYDLSTQEVIVLCDMRPVVALGSAPYALDDDGAPATERLIALE